MKFLSDILAKAGLTVDGVVTLNNTATGQTPASNDNSTKLATTAWVRTFVQPYSLPIASTSILGGIKVGTGLSIDAGSGILSVTGGGAASIKSTQTFTATAAQTVFTIIGGYSVGLIDVFLNGVYLSPNQTTATNGTTVILGDAAAAGDIIDVIVASPVYEGATTTTDQLPEGVVNLYYTDARSRAAISLTVTGTSGASTYNSSTGVLNVPTYTLTGLGGVASTRTLTINGVTYDLTANRTWSALPTGGTAGQLLAKVDGTDYNAQWVNEAPAASYTSQVKHQVKASQAITKGQAVYVSSADGTNMIVSKASNATEGTSSKTMGLLETTVSTNGFTNVIAEGLLGGLNTNGANAGDPVWLGTDGNLIYGLLNKPTAPTHLVFIGVVTRANANNGEIFVKVQNGFEMNELHDYVESGVQNNYVISYESSTDLYKPKSIATLLGYTPANAARTLTINGTAYDLTADRTWTLTTANISEVTNLYYTDARVGTYLTNNSYATQTYVNTAVSNLVDAAPGTLDTLNELAAALGDDPNFATTVATSIGTKEPAITAGTTGQYWRGDKSWQTLPVYTLSGLGGVPTTRTITINGTAQDLSADRTFTINSMVYPGAGIALSTGSAWGTSITDNSANWNTAFGWGNHASGGYLTTALAATTYASLTGAYANPAFVASLAWSKITGAPAFITSYTEVDTLATVTGRGNSTTSSITVNGDMNSTGIVYSRANQTTSYTTAALWTQSFGSTLTGIAFHISGVVGRMLYMNTTDANLYWNGTALVYNSGTWSINVTGNAATATNVAYSGLTGTVPTWNQNTTGTAANSTLWNGLSTPSGYTSTGTVDKLAGGLSGLGDIVWLSQARVQTFLGLGSLAYSSATIPTNNNQLTNGAGYITSYSETDTLASVTGRGATTSTSITAGGIITAGTGQGFKNLSYQGGYNRIWSFGSGSEAYGIGYYQGATAPGGSDCIGFHFSNTASPLFYANNYGNASFTGTISASNFSGTHSGTSSGTNTGDQDLSSYVTLTGTQTITGQKTVSREAASYGGTVQSFLIDGAAGNGALTINAASAYAYLTFAQAGVSKFEIGAEGAATNKGSLYFNHNVQVGSTGSALYLKKSNGYVGINQIDPTYQLHINTSANEGIYLKGSGGGVWMNIQSGAGNLWSVGAQNDGMGVYNRTSSLYAFFIKDSRQVQFSGYTSSSSYSGTAAGYLAFDSSGNIITLASVAATDSSKLPLAGGTMSAGITFSAPGGTVLLKHAVTEVDAWIFQENAANWGLYWKNAPTGHHTFGGYTTVGAELFGMSAVNSSGNGVTTTNFVGATSAIAQWMISNFTGYIWSASTIYAQTSMVVGGSTVWHAGNLTNLNQLTNGPGYLTSVSIGNMTDAYRFWNNMGNNHSTHTDFNSVSNFGFRYIQGTTNGPGTGSSQFYGMTLGLGNEYAYGTYAMQLAIPRYLASDKYITFRTQEAGTWSGWTKISAGYADSAGSLSNMNISQFTNNSAYITSASYVAGLNLQGIGSASVNVNNGGSAVYRNENGSGGNLSYAPVLHLGGGDTMWQIQGDYYNSTDLRWRAGYAGTWYSWRQILHSANYQNYAVPLSGGTMSGTLSFQQPVGLSFANGQYIKDNGAGGLIINSGAAVNIGGTAVTFTGTTYAYNGIQMYRNGQANTGISWYNASYYNWQEYMASAGATGCGPNGNLTAPGGLYQVSSWALRSRMETVGSYGWLWEVGGGGGGVAAGSAVMELDVYGNLRTAADVIAYASDGRLKTNVKVIENAISKVQAIRGVEYDWLENIYEDYGFKPTKMHEVGVIAQEVEAVLPEVVLTAPFNGAYKDKHGIDPNFLTVKYDKMVPLLIEAIKEQQTQIESQKSEIDVLKDLVQQLINR